jgi:hypothetical protein
VVAREPEIRNICLKRPRYVVSGKSDFKNSA